MLGVNERQKNSHSLQFPAEIIISGTTTPTSVLFYLFHSFKYKF